jgi:hypothetical protein
MRKRLYSRLRRESIDINFPANSSPTAYEASGN